MNKVKDNAKEILNQLKEHSSKHIEWFEEWIEEEKDDAEKVAKYKNAIEINSQIDNALEYALKCIDIVHKMKSKPDKLEVVPKANWECDKKNLKASFLRDTIHKCSNCGNISLHHTYYCCNCGAKMEKVINPNTKEEWNFREGL